MTMGEEDPFNDIIAGLDIKVVENDVVDVTKLGNEELIDLFDSLDDEVTKGRQAIHPNKQWARDAHSLRNAAVIELRKRGFK